MVHATYEIASGVLRIPALNYEANCSAGRGAGLNNPLMVDVRNVGPLPPGVYSVRLEASRKFRRPAFRLLPKRGNQMHGRSGFWIHGGTVSHGCILATLPVRQAIQDFGVRTLTVVASVRPQGVYSNSDAQLTPPGAR